MVHRSITMDTYGMDLGPLLAAGETLDVEFKRRLGKVDLYQAVVCMANGTGGLILVGVDDDRDPVREWVFSTRTPDRVIAAIRRAQRG